jgi:Pathogenicity locus
MKNAAILKEAPPAAKQRSILDLQRIPGVGPSIASDLYGLGVRQTTELRGRSPEALYEQLCRKTGQHVDRCVLYVFRCAVHFATEPNPHPEMLKWWNWKDRAKPRQATISR